MSDKIVFGWLPSPLGGMSLLQQGFFDSFFNFCTADSQDRQLFGGYTWSTMGYIPASRSALIRTFIDKTDGDRLLMLDWDIDYDPEDVYALYDISEPGKIVSGCYVTYLGEDSLLRPCWFEQGEGDAQNLISEVVHTEIIPLVTCGMGFTMMHREDLLKIEAAHKDDPWPWFGHDVIGENRTGEDLTFCKRARELGITVWGHGGVQLGHTKSKTFHPRDMADPMYARARQPEKRVLNVGGGSKNIPIPATYSGWDHILLDIDKKPGVDIALDARELVNPPLNSMTVWTTGSMLGDAMYDAVYCSHNLEHYEMWDIPKVLAGFYRVLKPGGTVELHTPNFEEVFRIIDGGAGLDDVAYQAPVGPIRYRDIVFGYEKEIEESGNPYYCHRTAIRPGYLHAVLEAAGFTDVKITVDGLALAATAVKGA